MPAVVVDSIGLLRNAENGLILGTFKAGAENEASDGALYSAVAADLEFAFRTVEHAVGKCANVTIFFFLGFFGVLDGFLGAKATLNHQSSLGPQPSSVPVEACFLQFGEPG